MTTKEMINTEDKSTNAKSISGLIGLESYIGLETFIYILKSMYHIIFKASNKRESKAQLHRRVLAFEKQSNLPGFMSSLPIDILLEQLEDAQYLYPVRRRETELPIFN